MPVSPSQLVGRVPGGQKFYRQLLNLQDVLYAAALDTDTEPSERAACARAWEVLEERKRIMRGRPLPGSLRPAGETKRKAASATVVYPSPGAASAPAIVNDTARKPAS